MEIFEQVSKMIDLESSDQEKLKSFLPEDLNEGAALLRPRRHQETVRVAAESAEPPSLAAPALPPAPAAAADLSYIDAIGSEDLSRNGIY